MTNKEIKETLKEVCRIYSKMDKKHVKQLLQILIDAQVKKSCASFVNMDMRKTTKKLLVELLRKDHVNNYLTRRKMKQIYIILGDYGVYPKCKLCGKPIVIDSYSIKHETQSQKLAFSWDHEKPKSLGGSYDLANMQPTHKICNCKRGIKPVYSRSYKIRLKIKMNIVFDLDECCNSKHPRYRPSRFGLRKQDAWCHKQTCQYYR